MPDRTHRNRIGGFNENHAVVADPQPRSRLPGQSFDVAGTGFGVSVQFVDYPLSTGGGKLTKLFRRADRITNSFCGLYYKLR